MSRIRRDDHHLVRGGGGSDDQVSEVDRLTDRLDPSALDAQPLRGPRVEGHDRGARHDAVDEGSEALTPDRVGVALRPEPKLRHNERGNCVLTFMTAKP